VSFSNEPTLWRPSVVAPSEENCEDAVEWIKTFQGYGNACIMDALKVWICQWVVLQFSLVQFSASLEECIVYMVICCSPYFIFLGI
jgi:hypothetical protein